MRVLNRNRQPFFYALFDRSEPEVDVSGKETGEWNTIYGAVQKVYGNISPARGESSDAVFGVDIQYDKVIALMDTDITETSILWIGRQPAIESDGTSETPYDYIVTRVAKSLNSVLIAISRVDVS